MNSNPTCFFVTRSYATIGLQIRKIDLVQSRHACPPQKGVIGIVSLIEIPVPEILFKKIITHLFHISSFVKPDNRNSVAEIVHPRKPLLSTFDACEQIILLEHIGRPEILNDSDYSPLIFTCAQCPAYRILISKHFLGERLGQNHLVLVLQNPVLRATGKAVVKEIEEISVYRSLCRLIIVIADHNVCISPIADFSPRLDLRNRREKLIGSSERHSERVAGTDNIQLLGKRLLSSDTELRPGIRSQQDDKSQRHRQPENLDEGVKLVPRQELQIRA